MELEYKLQYETFDDVPDKFKESFVEFKDGEQTLFLHKEFAETKKELYRTKGDLTHTKRQQQSAAEQVQKYEEAERLRNEELERAKIEKMELSGQHKEIVEHQRARFEQERADLAAKLQALEDSVKSEKKAAIVSKLSSVGTSETIPILERLISLDLDFGEDGNLIVIENGKASSTSVDEYAAKLKFLYPQLVSESHGKGGQSKGAGSGCGGMKKPSDMSTAERLEFKQRDPIGFKQAFNL